MFSVSCSVKGIIKSPDLKTYDVSLRNRVLHDKTDSI